MDGSQNTLEKCSQTNHLSGPATGVNTRKQDNLWLIVTSMRAKTGSELENASTPGNAEVPESVKDKDGAMVTTHARKSTNEQPNV